MQLDIRAPFKTPIVVEMVDAPPTAVLGVDRFGATRDCRSSNRGIDCTGSVPPPTPGPTSTPRSTPTPYGSPARAFLGGLTRSLLD